MAEPTRRDAVSTTQAPRCKRCGGTGNELLSLFRTCSDCHGSGVADPDDLPASEERV